MTAWNLRPIASALWRNRTGALLVAFQIAIGLAVLVNAVYVVKQRVEKIGRPTGMDTANMIWVASAGFAKDYDYEAATREDLAALRGLPGVKAASLFSNIPLSGGGSSNGFQAKPGEVSPKETIQGNNYDVDEQAIAALGVKLIAGRPFEASEILPPSETYEMSPQAIVTRAFAKEMFPKDPNPLGKTFYDGLSRAHRRRRHHGAHARCLGRLGQAGQYRAVPAHEERTDRDLPRQDRARPARRGDARHRGQARRLEPRPPAALGPSVRLLHQAVLPRRPQHGDLPRQRDERAARDHRARHLRPRDLQRLDAHPPDRHAPRGRRPQARHRASLPGRELDGHDRGHRRRLRRRARHRLLDLGQVRAAAPRPLLPRRRRARDLADRPRRGPAAGAPGLAASRRRWRAGRFRLARSFQPLRQTRHPN